MSDYISREAAYSLAKRICDAIASGRYRPGIFGKDILDWIDDIPAADVREVKRGKWTLHKDGSATCSVCKFVQNSAWDLDNWDKFCHHCGADMRPQEEGE